MDKRPIMKVPEDVRALADAYHNANRRQQDAQERREEKEKRQEEAARRERITNGLLFAEQVWEWASFFREDPSGRKFIEVGHDDLGYLNNHGVFFFDGQAEGSPWYGLGVGGRGLWWIRNGCGASPRYLESAEDLADAVPLTTLALACEWIASGEVWSCLIRRFSLTQLKVSERPLARRRRDKSQK